MKRILLLMLVYLAVESSYAQINNTNSNLDSQPITTTGISLPQLITTNLNRSNLQFKVNLSEGLKRPNLAVQFEKFISDSKKQFTLMGGTSLSQAFSFDKNDNRDFYSFHGMTARLGADLKLFNKKDYFLQLGTQNSINKVGGITDYDFINTYNSLTVGFGKGRINFSNDGATALAIIDKLSQYGLVNRDITEEEYLMLAEKIRVLKNRRKFVNRSYPLTEEEELQDLLLSFGVIKEGIDVIEVINSVYQFEPMFDRTTGSQFSISATGSYSSTNIIPDYNNLGLEASISYSIHIPLNSKWQYNRAYSGYLFLSHAETPDPLYNDDKLKRAGLSISNEIHYLVDTRIRYSVSSTAGYDFVNKHNALISSGQPFNDQGGFYLNSSAELQYQISRTMSTTFGINLNINPVQNITGLKLGLNF